MRLSSSRDSIHRRAEGGQALVIMAIAMSAVLGGTALVVDGGNAMEQQRATQNATDAAALAGSLVIAQKMGGATERDAEVSNAMSYAFTNNASTMETSYYVDFDGNVVGTVG